MNLLMITRKIDKDDWLAGHGYEWAKSISGKLKTQSAKLFVICLEKGNTQGLPENVEIYSLGKETGNSRWQRFWKLQKLVLKLVPKVDGIFCHQNAEYAISISPMAFLYRLPIVSWYTHKSVTWKTRWMLAVSKIVLTASKESFRLTSPKVKVVGHGIDISKFKNQNAKIKITDQNSKFRIITVGRVSPIKDLETLILAAKYLREEHRLENFEVKIVGDVGLPEHQAYFESLKLLIKNSALENLVKFEAAIPHDKVNEVFQQADVFVNLSQTGSVDKAVLEAMACECAVVTSNEAFFEILKPFADLCLVKQNDPKQLSEKLIAISKLNESDRNALGANLRNIVVENHSLEKLAKVILNQFESDTIDIRRYK